MRWRFMAFEVGGLNSEPCGRSLEKTADAAFPKQESVTLSVPNSTYRNANLTFAFRDYAAKLLRHGGKFEKRFAKKPFDKIEEKLYEMICYDGRKPVSAGRSVLVGYERTLKNNADGYSCTVLPTGEYVVFDMADVNGDDSGNGVIEKWFAENSSYVKRELCGNNFILKCYCPENPKDGYSPDSKAEVWIPILSHGRSIIPRMLEDPGFDYISDSNREFISAFDEAMLTCGYSAGNTVADGICWGRHMLVYSKIGAKSADVVARIYMRDDGICLRMFLNNVSKHGKYIAGTPDYIKSVFTGEYGCCKHCKGDNCKFRKNYDIEGVSYEKCNGMTFEFYEPTIEKLPEYLKLFSEFFPQKKNSIR